MIWLDHSGEEVPYTVLQPGEGKLVRWGSRPRLVGS